MNDIKLPTWLPPVIANAPSLDIDSHKQVLNGFFDNQVPNQASNLAPLAKIQFNYSDSSEIAADASLQLTDIDAQSPFSNLLPGDNLFLIKSDFYDEIPLVIRGPGAGATVTASGVLADLLSLTKK